MSQHVTSAEASAPPHSGEQSGVGVEFADPKISLNGHIPEAVVHLQSAVRSGTPWQKALVEAMGMWTLPSEEYRNRAYNYLIQGEAFDWLLLAERLCSELDGLIPSEEKETLLFQGRIPEQIEPEEFRDLLGTSKYRGYLNYCYGVVVEEALQLGVEEDVRKRHKARGYSDSEDMVEEAFTHLYGESRTDLLDEFRRTEHLHRGKNLTLDNLKQFNYWLFKRRFEMWDPARVASDTRKGLRRLRQLEQGVLTVPKWEGVE
ncbi:MAG TPA: hypothetical protein DCL97_11515 [Dehalococcoidia bacterium]|nr:hypothetical protein [Dehalococcoidia bacterium]